MTYTREDWKAAREAMDVIEAKREKLLEPTKLEFVVAMEGLAAIEEEIGTYISDCEGCSEPLFEGEPYHHGEDVYLCQACAPSYADMLASHENFHGDNDEPMTADDARAIADAHVLCGGSLEDKIVSP